MTHNYQNFKAWAVGLMKIELSTHIYIFTHPSLFLLVHYKKKYKMIYYFTKTRFINIIYSYAHNKIKKRMHFKK